MCKIRYGNYQSINSAPPHPGANVKEMARTVLSNASIGMKKNISASRQATTGRSGKIVLYFIFSNYTRFYFRTFFNYLFLAV